MGEACWSIRPCDEEMKGRCAHALAPERCPVKCVFGQCHKPQRRLIDDFALFAGLVGECEDAVKDECLYCEVYLKSSAARTREP